jgi:hypothetical protein
MPRALSHLVGLGCCSALLMACYWTVLFEDGQFAFRDAGNLFYPLYLRVQQEWDAGRWPLWNDGQNGGEPLLGNANAAVFYPGKVLYALLPYPWATRLFVLAHTIAAFAGVVMLARGFGVSRVGSYLGGLCYAFGAPVLFLYCFVNRLVGAAWIPWGLWAIDRMLRRGRLRGVAELAVILTLEILAGDPEAAYLTAVCGAGYAVLLAMEGREGPAWLFTWPTALVVTGAWIAGTLGLAASRWAPPPFRTDGLVLAAWTAVALVMAWRWSRRPHQARLAPLLARLAGALILAGSLAAVQILTALEFAGQSWRAGGIPAPTLYRFSVEPCRFAELLWPNVFGTSCPENRSWIQAIPPVGAHEPWTASLYMGGATLVLALGAAGWKSGPPWRAWLTTIAVVGLLASLGKYGSPLWWARETPLASLLGPHDPGPDELRPDPFLYDGTGSPFGLLATLLPGFGGFRFPAKFVTFAAVALAVLVGAGWDRATTGGAERRRLRRLGLTGLASSLAGLALALAARGRALGYLVGRVPLDSPFGPADIPGAWAETQWALAQGAIVLAAILALVYFDPRRPRIAGVLALVCVAADLATANAKLIWTAPQAVFDAPSRAAQLIEEAERSDPSQGPFRIHRMTGWYPTRFIATRTPRRFSELITWNRETLHPLAGLPLGLEYGLTIGSVEIEDYITFFQPRMMPMPDKIARAFGVNAGEPLAYFPRRSFDLWGARYFILPATPEWGSTVRGFASFLDQTELIYPSSEALHEEPTSGRDETWSARQDWQLRRNKAAYPRAWIVHSARVRAPARDPQTRGELMRTLAFMNDPIWNEPDRPVLDLRQTALIEADDKEGLKGFLSPAPVGPSESVTIVEHGPQRVVLRATLERPGLVILADTDYPGWNLTIDGKPAPIYRANRMMRGAAVPAGPHTLVYTYRPASFLIGSWVSVAGVCAWMVFAWWSRRESASLPSPLSEICPTSCGTTFSAPW